jgi:adrenodoxin-NADP+ reductase
LLLSYGASKDRKLGVPGEEELAGIYSARAFVGWYNGLPEYANLASKLLLDSAEEAVVIGQGNVAMDVARILLTDVDVLRKTDITAQALETLSRSRVKRVRVVGRRGPLQAAFTVKELRELLSIPGVGFPGVDPVLIPEDTKELSRQQKRIAQILERGSKTPPAKAQKQWELKFLRSPSAFLPSVDDATTLGAVRFDKTSLDEPFSATSRALSTGEHEDLEAQMAFRSIGYLSEPIPGFKEAGIPFNEKRGLVPNEDGRVVRPAANPEERGEVVPGVYTSGWVKRGPTGVIASTMYDAFETADAIVNDWVTGEREFMNAGEEEKRGWEAVQGELKARGMRPVSWDEWRKIDAAEKERGARLGKDREKFVSEEEMLAVLE